MRKTFRKLLIIGVVLTAIGCQTKISRLHKAKILDITMDSSKTFAPVDAASMQASQMFENTLSAASQNLGSTCPTCGS